ncbi:hypothetical protein ACPOL_3364 [Acidisarcina polymorpha]|uniref:Uncharacterized protein n=1 Tax=Acidisarcina polymorpha TaxID=2211140 RepID=A0A2Z5G0F9_9BACT|nr:hypothetical protein ACPOL_3364 [Acidisarcina polymorpha]
MIRKAHIDWPPQIQTSPANDIMKHNCFTGGDLDTVGAADGRRVDLQLPAVVGPRPLKRWLRRSRL